MPHDKPVRRELVSAQFSKRPSQSHPSPAIFLQYPGCVPCTDPGRGAVNARAGRKDASRDWLFPLMESHPGDLTEDAVSKPRPEENDNEKTAQEERAIQVNTWNGEIH